MTATPDALSDHSPVQSNVEPSGTSTLAQNRSRRNFLGLATATGAGLWTVDKIAGEIVGDVYQDVEGRVRRTFKTILSAEDDIFAGLDQIDSRKLALIRNLLWDKDKRVRLVGGTAHARYPRQMHPDDEWACKSVLRVAHGLATRHAYENPIPEGQTRSTSYVCTGSPVSNAYTRSFMEYDYVDRRRPELGLARRPDPVLNLAFEYDLLPSRLGIAPDGGNGQVLRPNWCLLGRGRFTPTFSVDEDEDYLLISRLPNWVGSANGTLPRDHSVTILGGCHGAGTGAVELLFDSLELLERLEHERKKYRYWQAIVRVRGIKKKAHPYSRAVRSVAGWLHPELVEVGEVTLNPRFGR